MTDKSRVRPVIGTCPRCHRAMTPRKTAPAPTRIAANVRGSIPSATPARVRSELEAKKSIVRVVSAKSFIAPLRGCTRQDVKRFAYLGEWAIKTPRHDKGPTRGPLHYRSRRTGACDAKRLTSCRPCRPCRALLVRRRRLWTACQQPWLRW